MNKLSLFNGMSIGCMAIESLGVTVSKSYISEIDKYANKAAQALFPDSIQLGDVTKWREWDINWSSIDLVTGGFPCQAWSMAGKQLGDKDERGMLFWTMLDIMKHVKYHNPKANFLIENVKMKKEFEEYITTHTENALGHVYKILINSALVSAQNRNRYYWTSFEVEQPEDKGVVWGDIREYGVYLKPMYYTDKAMEWIGKHGTARGKKLKIHSDNEKMQMVEASHYKKYSSQRFFGIVDSIGSIVGRRINERGVRDDYNKEVTITQCLQVKEKSDKTGCLTTVQKDNVISQLPHGRYPDVFNKLEEGKRYRYITPRECMRLQTVPENHIDTLLNTGISNTQLYKMTGNAWTMEVIRHIFKQMIK